MGLTSKLTYEVDSFNYKDQVVGSMRENITRQTKFKLTYRVTLERERIPWLKHNFGVLKAGLLL